MTSRRTEKVAQAIREAVSSAILFELRDPRVKNVTVLGVDVSGDVRSAKVYVSVMGDENAQKLTMRGLNSSTGFLQSKVADRIKTRYTPILKFVLDDSVKRSIQTSRILNELEDQSGESDADQSAEETEISSSNDADAGEHTAENDPKDKSISSLESTTDK